MNHEKDRGYEMADDPLRGERLRFGLDLDGVIYNWHKTARYMLRTEFGYPKDGPLGDEEVHTEWNSIAKYVTKDEWNWLWNTGVKKGLFRYGHLYSGSIEAIRQLSFIGDCVIITHRPRQAVQDTLDWLAYLKLPWMEIHLLTNGEPKSSIPHCDLYVDDKPENITDYLKNTHGYPILWDRPWNRSWVGREKGYGVVHSWEEVIADAQGIFREGQR
jgi:hypothetical protein